MKPWTERHRAEALRRTYEIIAEQADRSPAGRREQTVRVDVGSEDEWVDCLGWVLDIDDPARIDREVRRVRGLAEGRLVRWQGWQGTTRDGGTMGRTASAETAQRWKENGAKVVRVTRIRRAPR